MGLTDAIVDVGDFRQVCWRPGLEKHGCHAMILPWSYHNHGETWSWSCHDKGMATMFLAMVVMIHSVIMVWLPCFLWLLPWSWYDHHVFHVIFWKKKDFLSMFSQIVATIYHCTAHLTALRDIYASKLSGQQN